MTIAVVMMFVAGCASPRVDGIALRGATSAVSAEELRGALALHHKLYPSTGICSIEIVSRTEVHIYHAPCQHDIFAFVPLYLHGGRWHAGERIVGGAGRI